MPERLKIVTYNLRSLYTGDGVNSFLHRAGMILDKLNTCQPDVVCAQEAIPESTAFLKKNLSDYMVIYNGRDERFGAEGLMLLIKKSRINLVGLDIFWLSETPYVPGSRFPEQSRCPRICQTAMLQVDGTDTLFRVYNNHLDHISDNARVRGIGKVMEKVSSDHRKLPLPAFILGDFNAGPESETLEYCRNYRDFEIAEVTGHIGHTFHDFGRNPVDKKIDYIFADKATASKVVSAERWDDCVNGIYLSDHYPICMTVDL